MALFFVKELLTFLWHEQTMMKSLTMITALLMTLSGAAQIPDYLYFGDTETNNLRRCDQDGSNLEVLFPIQTIREVEVDEELGKVYFIDSDADMIRAYDLSAAQISDLSPVLQGINAMHLDLSDHRFFFTSSDLDVIGSMDQDGQNFQIIAELGFKPTSVEFDPCSQRVFFTDADAGRILSMHPDGSDQQVHISGLTAPKEIEIDVLEREMYFTETNVGFLQKATMETWEYENYMPLSGIGWASMEINETDRLLYYLEFGLGQLKVHDLVTYETSILCSEFIVPSHIGIASCQSRCFQHAIDYCSDLPYEFNGEEITESGTYSFLHELASGCDSLETLELIIGPPLSTGLEENYTITLDGNIELSIDPSWSNVTWSTGDEGNTIILYGMDLGVGAHSIEVSGESTATGCQTTAIISITVEDGMNTAFIDMGDQSVVVYPNPAKVNSSISIRSSEKIFRIDLLSFEGKRIASEIGPSLQLPASTAPGYYLVKGYTVSGVCLNSQLFVQH